MKNPFSTFSHIKERYQLARERVACDKLRHHKHDNEYEIHRLHQAIARLQAENQQIDAILRIYFETGTPDDLRAYLKTKELWQEEVVANQAELQQVG